MASGFDQPSPPCEESPSGSLRLNDQVNITVQHTQQREKLIDRRAVVRLIEQTIQPLVIEIQAVTLLDSTEPTNAYRSRPP
jgi:hypothetical protein